MKASDLIKKIDGLIEKQYKKIDSLTKQNILKRRAEIADAIAALWTKAQVNPHINTDVGGMVYVSLEQANRYNRLKKLDDTVKGIIKAGAVTDISNIELNGVQVYELERYGYAWVYEQGYGLPVTGGAKVPLVAKALYSELSGGAFDDRLRQNWAQYQSDILSLVRRGLNNGLSYTEIARGLENLTDAQYARVLRVARTEAHRIQMEGHLDTLALLDETGADYEKMWVSVLDSSTRDRHASMDGQIADKNGLFHLPGGNTTKAPGLTGYAEDDINCRCSIVEIIDGIKPSKRYVRGEGLVPFETYREYEKHKPIPLSVLHKYR